MTGPMIMEFQGVRYQKVVYQKVRYQEVTYQIKTTAVKKTTVVVMMMLMRMTFVGTNNTMRYTRRVTKSSTTKTGRKKKCDHIYDTRHYCPSCRRLVINFVQHIFSKMHSKENEMVQISSKNLLDTDSQETKKQKQIEKKRMVDDMRRRSDNMHNENVLKKKAGEIIIRRWLKEGSFCVEDYGPCPCCLEWLRKTMPLRHQKSCVGNRKDNLTQGDLLLQSDVISGRITESPSTKLLSEVYPIMLNDNIGKTARNDDLIIRLGNQWMVRNIGNELMRKYYTSAVMRLCSRLLLKLRGLVSPPTGNTMVDYLAPEYFDQMAKASLQVAAQDDYDDEILGAPSNAIKLSYDIKRLCGIKLGLGIKIKNQEMKEGG